MDYIAPTAFFTVVLTSLLLAVVVGFITKPAVRNHVCESEYRVGCVWSHEAQQCACP